MCCHSSVQGRNTAQGPSDKRKCESEKCRKGSCVKVCTDYCIRQEENVGDSLFVKEEESVTQTLISQRRHAIFRLNFGGRAGEQTCRKKVIGCWPIAWASPMLALMTSANGFFIPCIAKRQSKNKMVCVKKESMTPGYEGKINFGVVLN